MKLFAAAWAYLIIAVVVSDYLPPIARYVLWAPLACFLGLMVIAWFSLVAQLFWVLAWGLIVELPKALWRALVRAAKTGSFSK
jgi:hypothetical protein